MNASPITQSHQKSAPWEWLLDSGSAQRLAAAPHARWLRVCEGRVWLTRSGAGPHGDDVWLNPGDRALLPAGTEWVAEGWPAARVTLLQAPAPVKASSVSPAFWPLLRAA